MTYVDLAFTAEMEMISDLIGNDWRNDFKVVQTLCEKVNELPKIKDWRAKRPVTEM